VGLKINVKMSKEMRIAMNNREPLYIKCKAIPLQALTGPEGSRRSRLPDFNLLAPEFGI
jgi:hypothetical protein